MNGAYGLGVTNCRSAPDVIGSIAEAEALGADIAFVAEDVNCRDTFQLCAAAAGATTRIKLATGVVNPYTRNPTALAMSAATLDELSQGRAVIGIGSSSPSLIDTQMGIPYGSPAAVMRESVGIVRALLRGQTVTRAGKRFTYADATLEASPVQPSIPIYFAAMGPRMLRLAGEMADGVLLNVGATVEYARWAVQQIHEGATAAGRDPKEITVAAWLTTYITDDREASMGRARAWLATMLSIPRQGELLLEHAGVGPAILAPIRAAVSAYPHGGDRTLAATYVPEEAAERMTIIGDAAAARNRIDDYRAAGVQIPVLSITALRALYGQ